MIVDLRDDVVRLNAGVFRRTAINDTLDQDSSLIQLKLLPRFISQGHRHDAKEARTSQLLSVSVETDHKQRHRK